MLEIVEVKTRREQKKFVEYPNKLYKGNPYYVPPLYMDEMKMFKNNFIYTDTCECVYYNAYRDGEMVGRICGIIQRASNEKNNEKRVRFSRFDSVNDKEVSAALFDAVSNWAKERGMDTICGPLNFSDLEREGLLIDGFDELATFEEQYNYEYYQYLIEDYGFVKEVDWFESKLYYPDEPDEKLERVSEKLMKRYNLHIGTAKNLNEYLDKYKDGFFEIVDKAYKDLYGTVPFTQAMKDNMISNFKLIMNMDNLVVILDENDKVICMGLCLPSIAKAVQKSNGHLTPFALIKVLKSIKNPEIIDLALVGVDPEWTNRGISSVITNKLMKMLADGKIKYAETNLNLEDNYFIQNQWKRFKTVQHKKRRAFVKPL